jgi:DNA-binding CsgD family transcriptional regulator
MNNETIFSRTLEEKDDIFYNEFAKSFLSSIDILKPTSKQLLYTKKILSHAWIKLSIHLDDRLTHREKECLSLFYRGQSIKEVAKFLGMSDGTARVHRDSILKKLLCKNIREAIKEGVRYRLIQ